MINKPIKLCTFFGTFNPIHNAHLSIAEYALTKFNCDKLLFVPAFIPPHKSIDGISAKDRLQMVKLATKTNSKFEVSDIEFQSNKTSYTIFSIEKLYKLYNIDGKIKFLIGEDAFSKIETWYRTEDLKQKVDFIVFQRNGKDNIDKNKFEQLKSMQYNFEIIEIEPINISSTEIRQLTQAGKSLNRLVPQEVENYIKEKNLYTEYTEIKNWLKAHLSEEKYQHSLTTAKQAQRIAQIINYPNLQKAYFAGLLHDCAKWMEKSDMEQIAKEHLDFVTAEEFLMPKTLHAPLGVWVAQKEFGVQDKEILDAIRFHTIARKNMTDLEKIVFLADKIREEFGQKYFGADAFAFIEKAGINKTMEQAIQNGIDYLIQKGQKPSTTTLEALEYFKNI